MKRFHVHVSVNNLDESIRFYSTVFASEPSVQKTDYAKWMLDDPRVNFAISQRGDTPGINHLGIQVESNAELSALRTHLQRADATMVEQKGQACCYARSDKYWITDPAGIAWEAFHTLSEVPVYEESPGAAESDESCCIPLKRGDNPASGECCIPLPTVQSAANASCCSR